MPSHELSIERTSSGGTTRRERMNCNLINGAFSVYSKEPIVMRTYTRKRKRTSSQRFNNDDLQRDAAMMDSLE